MLASFLDLDGARHCWSSPTGRSRQKEDPAPLQRLHTGNRQWNAGRTGANLMPTGQGCDVWGKGQNKMPELPQFHPPARATDIVLWQ